MAGAIGQCAPPAAPTGPATSRRLSKPAWRSLDPRAYLNWVTLDFSRPGKPTDNGLIAAFNGRLRAECLADACVRDEHWFLTLGDGQARLGAWREDYNRQRPHGALRNMTPEEFAARAERGHPPGGDQGPHDTATTTRQRRPEPCPTG